MTEQALRCAELVDQWISLGLRTAMVAPGSRSTPLALALAERPEVRLAVFLDERSAAFAALGWSMSGGEPAMVLCTSGTAATHFHAAVVEAHQSGVPLLVVTADRPPELQGIGAPQTIEQTNLYGTAARWFVQLDGTDPDWREPATEAWHRALGTTDGRPGPIHLNLALRDPLTAVDLTLGVRHHSSDPDVWARPQLDSRFVDAPKAGEALRHARGVILAGAGVDDPDAVGELSRRRGWPVLADPRSRCRHLAEAICASDSILRSPLAAALRPELVVQLGMPPASKVVGQWIAASGAAVVAVSPVGLVSDPYSVGAEQVHAPIGAFCTAVVDGPVDSQWLGSWIEAERLSQGAIDEAVAGALDEISVARRLSRLPADVALVVSSSMPVRDVEWFGAPGAGPLVYSNRGANGIDGVLATAIGVALRGVPTTVLLGDVALCHDASSLAMLARRAIDLAVVVIDNDGGGIFSFLPQASDVAAERFEQLFGTPHGTDLVALAAAHGVRATTVATPGELDQLLSGSGVRLGVVRSERAANVDRHRQLNDGIEAALRPSV